MENAGISRILKEIAPQSLTFDLKSLTFSAFQRFFDAEIRAQSLQITEILSPFFEKARFSWEKTEDFAKYRVLPQFSSLKTLLKSQISANFQRIRDKFAEISRKTQENRELFEEIGRNAAFERFFQETARKDLRKLRETAFSSKKPEENRENLRFSLFYLAFLKTFRTEMLEKRLLDAESADFLFEDERKSLEIAFLNEFSAICADFPEENDSFHEFFGSLPRNFHKILKELNDFIRELQIQAESPRDLFENEFLAQICRVFFTKLTETQGNREKFKEIRGFFLGFDGNPQETREIPSNLAFYSTFLAKDVLSDAFVAENRSIALKTCENPAISSKTLDFDVQMSANFANLLVCPHIFKEKVAKSLGNSEKPIKMNQVQQSQTLVSSVLNKEDDYLSRMMEGVRFFFEFS